MRFIAAVALAATLSASASASELSDFTALLEGRFDNEMQIFFEKEQVKPGSAVRDGRQIAIRKAKDAVFAVQVMSMQFADHPLEETWTVASQEGRIETAITGFSETSKIQCVATWARDGAGYKIAFASDCGGGIARTGARLDKDGLEIGGRTDRLPPDQFKRIRPFECWVAVLRGAMHGDSGKGAKDTDWFFKRGVWIHDQGGLATIATDEAPSRDLRLRLRRVAWPTGPNRPSLTLYVLPPGDDDRAVSYAWGAFDAERLGINLRWMQASCTHAPDKLWP